MVLMAFTVFILSQFKEIAHIPVEDEKDIQVLKQAGERNYIMVDNSEADFISNSVAFLKKQIGDGTIPKDQADDFNILFSMFDKGASFDAVYQKVQDDEAIRPWLLACRAQFRQRVGTVEEVNHILASVMNKNGYSPILFEKYVTYMQICGVFLIFPLFLFLLTRDYRLNMYEMIYVQPISPKKYVLVRYLGVFLPLIVYLYLSGLVLNAISTVRLLLMGYAYHYTSFLPYFLVYLLPTLFFFSTVNMLLILLTKKAAAAFPLYMLFVLLNVTPRVFGLGQDWIHTLNPIIRLDTWTGSMETVFLNRSLYIVSGFIFIAVSCKIYQQLRHNFGKGISI